LLHFEINILNILNIFTEITGMAPPINVQDWYGDRYTCQIASGALALDVDDIIMAANSNFYQNLNEAISHISHSNLATV